MSKPKWTLDAIIEEAKKHGPWMLDELGWVRTAHVDPIKRCCPRGVLPGALWRQPWPVDLVNGEDPRTAELVTLAADNIDEPGSTAHDPPITDAEIQAVRKRLIDELGAKEVG